MGQVRCAQRTGIGATAFPERDDNAGESTHFFAIDHNLDVLKDILGDLLPIVERKILREIRADDGHASFDPQISKQVEKVGLPSTVASLKKPARGAATLYEILQNLLLEVGHELTCAHVQR
jgi:hypothetical protein